MKKVELELEKKKLLIETGRMGRQADGAVLVQYGDTIILATVVISKQQTEKHDFLPLIVDYREMTYAVGKIPGGFIKREGRPKEQEILISRLTDRALRPLLSKDIRHEIQILITLLSFDQVNSPDILAIIGASSSLLISPIPFCSPVAAVRVGYLNNNFILNPDFIQMENSKLDLVLAGTLENIVMIEGSANELKEEIVLEGIKFGHKNIKEIISLQEDLRRKYGKEKIELKYIEPDKKIEEKVREFSTQKIKEVNCTADKKQRQQKLNEIKEKTIEQFKEPTEIELSQIIKVLEMIEKEEIRRLIFENNIRIDGRKFDEIRKISCEVGVLPRTHGSALFTRGQTQALVTVTLGSSTDEQRVDELTTGEVSKKFMVHYNFPPFSTGDIKKLGPPGRREIGHGALAKKALKYSIPSEEKFPYTIRIVSDILESNGSSSMASVCGATLSLMDAGVPIKSPVAGIAVGLMKEAEKEVILTDILGTEDYFGDMDLKVAGTKEGITALQLDIKVKGIGLKTLAKGFAQAKEARNFILDKMIEVLQLPREKLSIYAPRIISLQIKPEKIREVIGHQGKVIKNIIEETKVEIDIKEDGKILIFSTEEKQAEIAKQMIEYLVQEIETGKVYHGKVTRIVNFGAFVEIAPGKEGLVHISQLANYHVKNVEDVVKEGDEFLVKVINIDEFGRINLSRKQALKN